MSSDIFSKILGTCAIFCDFSSFKRHKENQKGIGKSKNLQYFEKKSSTKGGHFWIQDTQNINVGPSELKIDFFVVDLFSKTLQYHSYRKMITSSWKINLSRSDGLWPRLGRRRRYIFPKSGHDLKRRFEDDLTPNSII